MDGGSMVSVPDIETSRLRLVALTEKLARLQLEDRSAFFQALGVCEEASWPPQLMDEGAMRWLSDELAQHPDHVGWYNWVYVSPSLNRLMGIGGFKGAPNRDGIVEIGYSMLISFREQGLATEGVTALLDWAYAHDSVNGVIAHTKSHRNPSHRVLEKAGFIEGKRAFNEEEGFEVTSWSHQRQLAAAE
jgi:ribosomal-protein-alanine N-acetyltransferase